MKVTLRQTGNTPALKNKTFWVQRSQTVRWVVEFIKQQLMCEPHESLVSELGFGKVSICLVVRVCSTSVCACTRSGHQHAVRGKPCIVL